MPVLPATGDYLITPTRGEVLVGRLRRPEHWRATTLAAAEDLIAQRTRTTRPRPVVWQLSPDLHLTRHDLTDARTRQRFYARRFQP